MGNPPAVGRFAPSPTGALHLGSLTTAAASFLAARHVGGKWLLRIEDLDTARVQPGAADTMLRTLESLGFGWDGAVIHQGQRLDLYAQALAELAARGLCYACSCTRRDLGGTDDVGGYPGTCRAGALRTGPAAIRFRSDLSPVGAFEDGLLGVCDANPKLGDPIMRRRDGLFAYQLAVVVDDAEQAVTDVVRGSDLLPSTQWQRCVQQALGLPEPRYTHLPLVCEPDGTKLSKSARVISGGFGAELGVQTVPAAALIWRVLSLLRQNPPAELALEPVAELWRWAIAHWQLNALRGVASLPADC